MALPGFQAQPSGSASATHTGDPASTKGDAKRKALQALLKMLGETQLKMRHGQELKPENSEVGSPQDRSSPEALDADSDGTMDKPAGQKRRGKSATMFGAGSQAKTIATHSKPQGVGKGTKYG